MRPEEPLTPECAALQFLPFCCFAKNNCSVQQCDRHFSSGKGKPFPKACVNDNLYIDSVRVKIRGWIYF